MPCYDDRSHIVTEYRDTPETRAHVANLTARNDLLMRSICALNNWAQRCEDRENYRTWLFQNPAVFEVIVQHEQVDADRWFNTYHKDYPDFTKTEIAKMVRAGILEDM